MKQRLVSLSLAILLLLTATACGGAKTETPAVTTASGDTPATSEAETEKQYDYQGKDYDGYTFTFLNYDVYVATHLRLAPEELTGEPLNDAMFDRNKKVEEKLNVKLVEDMKGYTALGGWGTTQANLCDFVAKSVTAGDYLYDVANVPIYWKTSLMTDGYLTDLNSIPELKLKEDYWDTGIIEALTISGKSFLGCSPFTLMPLDLTWTLLFNQNMMKDLKLTSPYDIVREGNWTLDKFGEYVKAGTSLNGDASFDWNENGKSVYGIAGHTGAPVYMLTAADNYLVTRDNNGNFTVNVESERLYNTIEKVQKIFSRSLGYSTFATTNPNSTTEPFGYTVVFCNSRALFLTAEIKSTLEERDMEDEYGLVPLPKLDETQAEYKSVMGSSTALLTVPTVQRDVHRTGLVLDALSFESGNVMDTFYYTVVGQKGLRNKDSEEMLDIVRAGWTLEFGQFFGITATYSTQIGNGIRAENCTPASIAASEKSKIEANIKTVVEAFKK